VVRIPEPRTARRLAKRREQQANEMTPELPEHLRAGRPRYGVRRPPPPREPNVRFGDADPRSGEDRRQAERRNTALTPEQIEVRMKALGISTDRRRRDRRGQDRRSPWS
jgi:hypothetical protein